MKLEEALTLLRSGAKIRNPLMPEDEYYMSCKISINPEFLVEDFDFDSLPISICWMKKDKQHPDMMPNWNPYDPKTDPCKHGMNPMINLLWLIRDDWEIVE